MSGAGPVGAVAKVTSAGGLSALTTVLRELPLDLPVAVVVQQHLGGRSGLAVVLTGMGRDGAIGAAAVKAAGGFVIVQSTDTADHPSMPEAAAVAAHLTLPLGEIGPVIADVVRGRPLPKPRSEIEAIARLFSDPVRSSSCCGTRTGRPARSAR